MTLKSVVDIDLNDEKFKRFTGLYDKYQQALSKQPAQWKNAEAAVDGTGDAVNKILAAFLATGQFHREMAEDNEKDNKNLKQKASLWDKINKASTGVLKDVKGIGKWMLKWGGIGFGLSLGGLFGLRAIAEDVAGQRNKALGLDLGIGQEQAFALHQGRYFNNPDQLLSGAFTARSNLASPAYAAIASLGINPNQSTVDIANQLLTKLQGMAKALPQQQVGNLLQEYPGLSQFGISLQDLERLRNLSPAELKGQINAYGKDAKAFGLSDRQGLAFQNFVTSIDSTFGKITKQIERDLVPLLGPIEKLVTSIGRDISMLLKSKGATVALDSLAKSIDRFATYIASGDFTKSVKAFDDGMGTFLNTIGFAAHVIANPWATTKESAGDIWSGFKDWAKTDQPTTLHGSGVSPWSGHQPAPASKSVTGGDWSRHRDTHSGDTPVVVMPQIRLPTPSWQSPIPGIVPHVRISVMNQTGGNLNYSINALNGGVGP